MMRVRSVVVPVCVALCAAVFSHIAIDVLGDSLVAHDTYDNVAHLSRPLFASFAALLTIAIGAFALVGVLREAAGSESALCRSLGDLAPRGGFQFVVAVIGSTLIAVAAMQALDTVLAGARIDGIEDLFGGSFILGLAVSVGTATVAGLCAWRAFRCLVALRATFVARAIAFLRRVLDTATPLGGKSACHPSRVCRGIVRGRPYTGRAPPQPRFVRH